MEESTSTGFFGLGPSTLAIVLLVAAVAIYAAYRFYKGRMTVPLPSYKIGGFMNGPMVANDASGAAVEGFSSLSVSYSPNAPPLAGREGFAGPANVGGPGAPSCMDVSSEGAALVGLFQGRMASYDEAADDLRELIQIVGKLSCFKKDLLSPSYIVEATRSQEYVTAHDIEPIAETTGRCLAKTISPRDLELAFDKWTTRGGMVIRRLCAEYKLSPAEVGAAENYFQALLRDVKDIARGKCLAGEPSIAGKPGPRDPHPYESANLEELGPYSGYY